MQTFAHLAITGLFTMSSALGSFALGVFAGHHDHPEPVIDLTAYEAHRAPHGDSALLAHR